MLEELDYFKEDEIICTHCGLKDKNSWERPNSGEITCSNCEKDFFYERNIQVTYTSKPIE